MKSYEIEAKLNALIGTKISLDGKRGKVLRYSIKNDMVKITMDTDDLVIFTSDIDQSISEMEINHNEVALPQVTTSSIIQSKGADLAAILMENIKKVKTDKDYIPQAQEINSNVKSIIELAKAEIEYVKTLAYLSKSKS